MGEPWMPSLCSMEAQTRSLRDAEAAVGIDQELRRHEQRNPARPRRRVRQSRKHEMDDVLGDIVFAPGDEDLGPEQAIVVAVRLRPRAYGGEVRARLRLGQVHRSGPLASNHLRQEALLELVGRMVCKRLDRAHGEHLTQREGEVGGFPHLGHGARNERRHSLPADVGARRHRVPTGFDELPVCLREAIGRGDFPAGPAATLAVAGCVQRSQHFGCETGCLGQDRIDKFRISLFETREGGDLRQSG